MPAISLHQRVTAPGTLQVWAGVTGVAAAPNVVWTFDGAAVNPQFVRPFIPARKGAAANAGELRVFTAIVSFDDQPAGVPHVVEASFGGARVALEVRAVPAEVPEWGFPTPLRILLASCYDRKTDKGTAGPLVKALVKTERPDFSLFVGDQVYLDLPTFQNLGHGLRDMAAAFEEKYVDNWFPDMAGYHELLVAGPAAFAADDHEYWNNYPHPAIYMDNTWDETVRGRWHDAALAMWEAFQLDAASQSGEPLRFDFPKPLSILVLDTRTKRTNDLMMSPTSAAEVDKWAKFVIDEKRIPILITGQTIFEEKAGFFGTHFGDARLANHDDYGVLVKALMRMVDAGRPVLCLTGDVHFGRILSIENSPKANRLYEVISSPVSLVENVVTNVFSPITSLFKKKSDWPKHSEPPTKPFTLLDFGAAYDFRTSHGQRGNHVVMLTFGRIGDTAVRMKATFHPLHPTKPNTPFEQEFDLR
jgi:hypothetical protein